MMRRRPARKGGVVKRAIRKAKKTVFAKRVKTVVNRMQETKVANYSINDFAISAWVNSATYQGTIKLLTPSSATGGQFFIAQGTGQGNRIGNTITTQKMVMRGVVRIETAFDGTLNWNMCPCLVACYVFRTKPQLNQAGVLSLMNTAFFQAGSQAVGFTGYMQDLTRSVNKNQVQLLKKRVFKVGTSQQWSGAGQYVTNAGGVVTVNPQNSNYLNQQYGDSTVGIAKMFSMDLTKAMQKKIVFNDADNGSVNSLTWIAWVPFRIDGDRYITSTGGFDGPLPAKVDYSIDYYFKDA